MFEKSISPLSGGLQLKNLVGCCFQGGYSVRKRLSRHRLFCFCLHPFRYLIVNVMILQIHNSNCSYSLSVVNVLEEQQQTFALGCMALGTATFSKELLLRSSQFNLNFLFGYCFLGTATVKRIYLKHQTFCKGNIIFSKGHLESQILQCVILFEKRSCGRQFILSNILASFGRSAGVIYLFM